MTENVHKIINEANNNSSNIFRAILFRNDFLKLHDPRHDTTQLFIFCWACNVRQKGKFPHQTCLPITVGRLQQDLFSSRIKNDVFTNVKVDMDKTQNPYFGPRDALNLVLTKADSVRCYVSLVCNPQVLVEAQLCKLLQYMCVFDCRTIPLLTLVRYWATINHIYPSGNNYENPGINIPFPAALDWLVITWMASQGLVPRPREILNLPHSRMEIQIHSNTTDVGFCQDPKFVQTWLHENAWKI